MQTPSRRWHWCDCNPATSVAEAVQAAASSAHWLLEVAVFSMVAVAASVVQKLLERAEPSEFSDSQAC